MATNEADEDKATIIIDTGDMDLEVPGEWTLDGDALVSGPVTSGDGNHGAEEGFGGRAIGSIDLGRASLLARLITQKWGHWDGKTACWIKVKLYITCSRRCRIEEATMECFLGDPRNDRSTIPLLAQSQHPQFCHVSPRYSQDANPTSVSHTTRWTLAPRLEAAGFAAVELGSREGEQTWQSQEGWVITGEQLPEEPYEDSKALFRASQSDTVPSRLVNDVTMDLVVGYQDRPFFIDFVLSVELDYGRGWLRTLGKTKRISKRYDFV